MVSSGASDKILVLAFDYRGFGHSTGHPTEERLITDAISVIKWAIEVAGIPPERIVLVAQSLGTAVATAAAAHFISELGIEFKGLVLCATFKSASSAFLEYKVMGWIPLLAPLRLIPRAESWFRRGIGDTWKTTDRLIALVKKSSRLGLTLLHATSDEVIPWKNCDDLFCPAIYASTEEDITSSDFRKDMTRVDLGEGGWSSTRRTGDVVIRQNVVKYGGELEPPCGLTVWLMI